MAVLGVLHLLSSHELLLLLRLHHHLLLLLLLLLLGSIHLLGPKDLGWSRLGLRRVSLVQLLLLLLLPRVRPGHRTEPRILIVKLLMLLKLLLLLLKLLLLLPSIGLAANIVLILAVFGRDALRLDFRLGLGLGLWNPLGRRCNNRAPSSHNRLGHQSRRRMELGRRSFGRVGSLGRVRMTRVCAPRRKILLREELKLSFELGIEFELVDWKIRDRGQVSSREDRDPQFFDENQPSESLS